MSDGGWFEWVSGWFSDLFVRLGFGNRTATLVLLGLDGAGKTTLQYRLKTGKLKSFSPTERANTETLTFNNITMTAYDLGGHKASRHLWRHYSAFADGIIFIVDASDVNRMEEARAELHALYEKTPQLTELPLLIMANKCDKKTCVASAELTDALALENLDVNIVKVFMTSVVKNFGYTQGLSWLAQSLPPS
jgi:small GTP-binding protein